VIDRSSRSHRRDERLAVAVVITATGGGWDARGHLLSDDDEGREGFVFLCDLDPAFMLRFEDGGTIPVTVHNLEQDSPFVLIEYTGPAQQSINHRIDL
jgi:hypothetical protein